MKSFVADVYVVNGNHGNLLSCESAVELGLISIANAINEQLPTTDDDYQTQYPQLFQGIGRLKNFQVKLHIDEKVPPVAQPHR